LSSKLNRLDSAAGDAKVILSMPGTLWYGEPDAISNAISYAKFSSRSHDAVIRV
jgi:hypothetical protein